MNYTITDNILLPQIVKKISEVAARAYSSEGTPLYDAIVPIERDNSSLIGYCVEALRTLADRFKGDAYLSDNHPVERWQIMWDASKEGTIEKEELAVELVANDTFPGYSEQELIDWMYADLTYIYMDYNTTIEQIQAIEEELLVYGYAIIYTTETFYPERVTITISIPTFDSAREASAQSAIEQYVIYTAVAKYLDERYPQGAKSYADRAAVMIEEVVRYMYQRLRPTARR